jgi:alpha 1,2-mannosyltransferase
MLLTTREMLNCLKFSICFLTILAGVVFATAVFCSWRSTLWPGSSRMIERKTSACNDDDCASFRRLLTNQWPSDKPRAAVVMLINCLTLLPNSSSNGTRSLFSEFVQRFDNYFNNAFNYPVIIFYEPGDISEADRNRMRASTSSTLFFQRVEFELPPYVNKTMISKHCSQLAKFGLGYRHMCRFHALKVYQEPILETDGLEYIWRLDDDSVFTRPVGYDVMRFMRNRKLQYAYALLSVDSLDCIVGLEEAIQRYAKFMSITPRSDWQLPTIVYNNFEISAASFWRSTSYRQFINYIDRLGGIYYYRWGDAPIKSAAVALLLQRNETHHFSDIGYVHQGKTNG